MQHKVTLDESEIGLARMIASLRTCNNRVGKVQHNVQIAGQDNFTNDLLGVCGEMVFAKTFNIYLDLCFHNRSGGHDLVLKGKTVDVKTTARTNGKLVVPMKKKRSPSEVYALVTGDLPTFTIRGYATADEVFSSVIDLGHGECYGLDQDQLHQFKINVGGEDEK